jgi:hypothetical protein
LLLLALTSRRTVITRRDQPTANGVTNKSVFDWSVNPVTGKKIYLVGDAWYPLGSG